MHACTHACMHACMHVCFLYVCVYVEMYRWMDGYRDLEIEGIRSSIAVPITPSSFMPRLGIDSKAQLEACSVARR